MQELSESLIKNSENFKELSDENQLQDASEKWALYCLKTFADNLLPKAIGISIAISAFLKELEMNRKGMV